jgi:preprotein translocase subunit YajC
MLISTAWAADAAPSAMEAVWLNILMIVVLVVLFYMLLIMPQQRRFKEHRAMLNSLRKGDKVITAGGLVGQVHKIKDNDEVVVDLGNDIKVTALCSTIQNKAE